MLKYLEDLKQALESIATKGTDTVVMGRCLESLNYQIAVLQQEEQNKNQEKQEE